MDRKAVKRLDVMSWIGHRILLPGGVIGLVYFVVQIGRAFL